MHERLLALLEERGSEKLSTKLGLGVRLGVNVEKSPSWKGGRQVRYMDDGRRWCRS